MRSDGDFSRRTMSRISCSEKPCESGIATCLAIALLLVDSVVHEIRASVEAEDVDSWPFVDAVLEPPDPPASLAPLVVDDAVSEGCAGSGREADAACLGVVALT